MAWQGGLDSCPTVWGCLQGGWFLCPPFRVGSGLTVQILLGIFPQGSCPVPADGKVNGGRSPEVCPAQRWAKFCFPVQLMHPSPAASSGVGDAGLGVVHRCPCWGMQPEASEVPMGGILQFYLKRIKAPNPRPRCCFSLGKLNLFFTVGLFILAFKACLSGLIQGDETLQSFKKFFSWWLQGRQSCVMQENRLEQPNQRA